MSQRAIYLVSFATLLAFAPPIAMADQSNFQPGELLVGYSNSVDRDHAAQNLSHSKDLLQVRGDKLEDVQVQPVGDKALRLVLRFPYKVRSATRDNPADQLALLIDVARQLKDNDGSIRYAHPNWVAEIKR